MPAKPLAAKELRSFGLLLGSFIVFFFGLLFPTLSQKPYPVGPWIFLAVLWAMALIYPKSLLPVNYVWGKLGKVMAAINTRIILGAVFYLVLTPIGVLRKFFMGDAINDIPKNNPPTYRVKNETDKDIDMERPF